MEKYDGKEKRTLAVFLFIFILLAAGLAGGGYISYRKYEKNFHAQVGRQLSSIAKLKVNSLMSWRKEHLAGAEMLYKNSVFAELVKSCFKNPHDALVQAMIQTWLEDYRIYAEYERVRLLDAEGQTLLPYPSGLPPISPVIAKRIPEVLQSKQVTMVDFYRSETDQHVNLTILIPIVDAQAGNQAIGLVAFIIDPQAYLYPLIQSWPTPSISAETMLVRRDGDYVLFLNELRFQQDTAMTLRIPFEKKEVPAIKAALGQEGIVEGSDYRGVPVIADVRAVPDSPWFLVAKMDTAEVYAPLRHRLWNTFIFFGVLIAAAGTGLGLVWRQQRLRYYRGQVHAAEALLESEARYERAVNGANDGIWEWIMATGEDYLSPRWKQLLGYEDHELPNVQASFFDRIHPEDQSRVSEAVSAHLEGRKPFEIELRLQCKSGEYRWFYSRGQAMWDKQGKPLRVSGSITDITERKQVELMLRESNEKFIAISVSAQDAIIMMDDEGNISFWNEAAERTFGYSRKEAVGSRVSELIIPHRYRLAHIEGLKKFKETGKGTVLGNIIELKAIRKDGKEFPIELSLSALKLKERWCAVGVIRDSSKRVRREEELRLSYKMASLGQLTAGIFHEILNPVNIISTHVQLLLADAEKGSGVEKDLKSIQEEIKRVQDITDGFLRFSRKESVATKEIDVNQLLNRVLDILVAEIKYNNIQLFKKFDNELPLFKANAELLRQVFFNLIKNAIDAMANGGSLTISTLKCLKDEKPCLCIQFTDTGYGIPKESLDKIFDPFFTTKEEGKGVGMGLTIAYTTIQKYGGSISVSSEVGKGSTFTIELPLQPTDQNKGGKL